MNHRELSVWLDERWCLALEKYFSDESLEDKISDYLDRLIYQLPMDVYTRVAREIWEEDQKARLERESGRRFAVFRIREGGGEVYFRAEHGIDMLFVAKHLRRHLQSVTVKPFADTFTACADITQAEFNAAASERMQNTGRVTGAFDIDMDSGTFTSLHITDGWQAFRIKDISTAAYFAMRKSYASEDERWRTFLDRLDGKQLTHTDTLSPELSEEQTM